MASKPLAAPFAGIIGGSGALITATLWKYRLLSFLHEDTILSGGKMVPTAQFAAFMSNFLYIGAATLFVFSFVILFTVSEEQKRWIATLPRWKRFAFWPIDRHIAPKNLPEKHPPGPPPLP